MYNLRQYFLCKYTLSLNYYLIFFDIHNPILMKNFKNVNLNKQWAWYCFTMLFYLILVVIFERIDPEYASPKEYSYLIHSYATSLAHSNSKDDDKNKMLLKRIMKRKMLLKELKIMYLDERWFHHNRWSFILLLFSNSKNFLF